MRRYKWEACDINKGVQELGGYVHLTDQWTSGFGIVQSTLLVLQTSLNSHYY